MTETSNPGVKSPKRIFMGCPPGTEDGLCWPCPKKNGQQAPEVEEKSTNFLLEDLKGVGGQGRLKDEVIDKYGL